MDKISLPDGIEELEPIEGIEREPEEMIILLAKKINEIVDWINSQ